MSRNPEWCLKSTRQVQVLEATTYLVLGSSYWQVIDLKGTQRPAY